MNMDFSLLLVEILTAALGLALLIFGLLVPRNQRKGIAYFTTAGLVGIFLATFVFQGANVSFLDGMYLIDPYSNFFKQLFLLAAILVSVASYDYIDKMGINQAEYYSLMVFATLGMMVLAGAGDLITLYLGLELMSISFCTLVCFKMEDAKSSEAALKYILLTGMSSAVLLYGLSLVYGASGTTVITHLAQALSPGVEPIMLVGTIFLLAGFGFKIAAVPFHMWSPDIYEGAPTPVTAFLAVASKAAGFAALVRVFMIGLPSMAEYWITLLVMLALLSVVLANLVAIPQTNVKRLLAYSSITQAGYLLLGVIAFSALGVGAILFHSLIYVFANLGAFMVVIAVGQAIGSDDIKDYSGLIQRAPLLAIVMLFALLSLAGIPFVAGFASKFFLFMAAIKSGYVWLALISVVMSMVSVYYYLIIVKAMYIAKPVAGAQPISISSSFTVALLVCLLVIVAFGIYPAPLLDYAMSVGQSFLP